ncbi:MAG: hypothetical protein E3J86_01785 [Candidatus Thorarchaeota archaeon]|nr:MAG: hypothetical protein E3J86_01785 [Candidatus Thorarchaeota archaeon]
MQWKKILFATIVGIILFIVDIKTGFIAFSLGGIPSIFLIVFIVGILAGDISGGFVAGILSELLGVGLLAVIPQILIPEATNVIATDILARMWLIMGISVSASTTYGMEPVPWLVGIILLAFLFLLAPFVFGFALLFGPIGGLIGRFIYPRIFKPKSAPALVPSQEPQPTPPAPEPFTPEPQAPEEVIEEESEDQPSLEPEPSE